MKLKLPHFKLWGPQTLSFYLILIPARTWEWLETLDIIFKTATLYSTVFGRQPKALLNTKFHIFSPTFYMECIYTYPFPKSDGQHVINRQPPGTPMYLPPSPAPKTFPKQTRSALGTPAR